MRRGRGHQLATGRRRGHRCSHFDDESDHPPHGDARWRRGFRFREGRASMSTLMSTQAPGAACTPRQCLAGTQAVPARVPAGGRGGGRVGGPSQGPGGPESGPGARAAWAWAQEGGAAARRAPAPPAPAASCHSSRGPAQQGLLPFAATTRPRHRTTRTPKRLLAQPPLTHWRQPHV